jgi:glutamine amidotransferase
MSDTVIVDYGTGNLYSILRCLDRLGVAGKVTSDPKDIERCRRIILPGVGHFAKAFTSLKRLGLVEALDEAVLGKRRPVLGVCLGMELLANKSSEGNSEGLGWIEGEVVRFDIENKIKFKVPHIGWNQISKRRECPLLKGIEDGSEFYFLHAYHFKPADPFVIAAETQYEHAFPSIIHKDNIFGVQYHAEKSRDSGLRLMKNFVEL